MSKIYTYSRSHTFLFLKLYFITFVSFNFEKPTLVGENMPLLDWGMVCWGVRA